MLTMLPFLLKFLMTSDAFLRCFFITSGFDWIAKKPKMDGWKDEQKSGRNYEEKPVGLPKNTEPGRFPSSSQNPF